MGVNHSVQGTETVTLLNTLAVLTGNIGRPGASPFSITGQCNAMGTRETGFTASMPGYRAYDDPAAPGRAGRSCWGIDEARLPDRARPGLPRHHQRGRVAARSRACGSSAPTRSCRTRTATSLEFALRVARPARRAGRRSRRRPPRSPTSCCPPRSGARRTARSPTASAGCRGCAPRSPRRARPAPTSTSSRRSPSAGAAPTSCSPGWRDPQDAFEEWRRVSAGRPCDYSGITWDRIDEAGGVQWPCPTGDDVPLGGTPRLYTDGALQPPDGRAQVYAGRAGADPRRAAARRTRSCSTPAARSSTGTPAPRPAGSRSSRGWRPRRGSRCTPPTPTRLASALGRLGAGGVAAAARSSASGLRVTAIVRAGEVFIPFHWDERCANRLTDRRVRPDQPRAELQAVRRADRAGLDRGEPTRTSSPGNRADTCRRDHEPGAARASRSGSPPTADGTSRPRCSSAAAPRSCTPRRSARCRSAPTNRCGRPPSRSSPGGREP